MAKRKPDAFTLQESFRWEPENGFLRLEQHMRRLARSADALGFRQPDKLLPKLEETVGGSDMLRVRLVMDHRGRSEIVAEPLKIVPHDAVWRVKIAQRRLDSCDSFYRHKSSRRDPYDIARAEFPPGEADEVLMLNEKGELCEGTTTSLFVEEQDGSLLTPPLESGILPGVLRADLIRSRRARGQTIFPGDLEGKRLFVGNSVYGLIRAELV